MRIRVTTSEQSYRGVNEYATLEQIQAVWQAVSLDGRAPIKDISRQTGIYFYKVRQVLDFLEGCGYIEHAARRVGRRVIIPFVTGEYVHAVRIKERTTPPKEPTTEPEAG